MTHTNRRNEAGIVAILVTMIMMIVITLIVLGFTDVTRRSERESLDSQLGTQAYYAAETGVNDAINYINANKGSIIPVTSCNQGNSPLPTPKVLKQDGSIAYTCLMVNPNPTSLKLDGVNESSAKQWHVQNGSGSKFGSLSFAWTPSPGGSNTACNGSKGQYPTYTTYTSGASSCDYPVLRVDIFVPAGVGNNFTADNLAANTVTLYLQPGPTGANNNVNVNRLDLTKAYQGYCTVTASTCSTTVNLSNAAQAKEYYVRLTTMYGSTSSVTLTGKDSPSGSTSSFTNGQYVIDATGRAQDQIKRIQVRVPYDLTSGDTPTFAVQSTDTICKDLLVSPSSYNNGQCGGVWPNFSGAVSCVTPRDTALVLDASSSMTSQWDTMKRIVKLKEVATNFLGNIVLGPGADNVGVIAFNPVVTIRSGLSYDQPTLSTAINGITTAVGTNYLTALSAATTQLNGGRAGAKKVMIFISDGFPDAPGNTAATILPVTTAMKASGVQIYTIGITVDSDVNATSLLSSMSGNGGRYYSAASELELEQFFQDIADAEQC